MNGHARFRRHAPVHRTLVRHVLSKVEGLGLRLEQSRAVAEGRLKRDRRPREELLKS